MDICVITVPISPVPWMRPGKSRGRFYDRQKPQKEQARVWISRHWPRGPIDRGCPVRMDLEFVMPIPESWSRKKKQEVLDGDRRHAVKPDRDNLEKFIKDCMTGIVYVDDCQHDTGIVEKRYGLIPGTIITIWLLDPPAQR